MDMELAKDLEKIITKLRYEAHYDRIDGKDNRGFLLEQVATKLEDTLKAHGYRPVIRAPRGMGFIPAYHGMYIAWGMSTL